MHRSVGDAWMLLNDNYKGMTSDVKCKGQISRKFEEGQGGANFSHVFKGKANPFLKMDGRIRYRQLRLLYVSTPTCADDVALLANSVTDLQTMTELAHLESISEQFQYSSTNSQAMIFQKNTRKNLFKYPITMNQAEIEYSEIESHLCLIRTPDNSRLLKTVSKS